MYFQIENTPEHIRRGRRVSNVQKESPKEECPRLVLAPFCRPPQVVFENVLIRTACERILEVFNPSKETQLITLGKALPPGLVIHLPGEWMEVEPESCYELLMVWTPNQPTAMRETIRFINEDRGRYDVIVVMKSSMNIKGKGYTQPKGFKTSPGKMKKKKTQTKKSPVDIYKKKSKIIYNTTTKIKKTVNVVTTTEHKVYHDYDKENVSGIQQLDHSINSTQGKCPFDSPSSVTNFDTSKIFADMRKAKIIQDTYHKSYDITDTNIKADTPYNVLRPSNNQACDSPSSDIFDNLTFTPLKSAAAKVDKLNKGPKVIISVNSESDFDDSLDVKSSNKENHTHSVTSIITSQQSDSWIEVNHAKVQNQMNVIETPTVPINKHPNTSSPKELSSPNFSINTDFSRISDLSFYPTRFSTERKCITKANETHELLDERVSSDTYTKDSPNGPIEYGNQHHLGYERPPHYFNRDQPKMCRQTLFREYQMQREAYDKNFRSHCEPNLWHNELRADARSPPRSLTPPLQSIPEESMQLSHTDNQQATFTIDRTFDKTHDKSSMTTRHTWSKKNVRVDSDVWKVPVVKKSTKPKVVSKLRDSTDGRISNVTFEANKSINQNITANQIGNVYTQTSTVDPFLSATYFYDEEAVHKFENDFKRWLNCILTPPADLESNDDQKIDLGKAWIESRNKDVPLAPTKEQVSSTYHNSHRLKSLRRSARSLFMSEGMLLVFQKLNAQIEKKLISIRADRNLHMDVGLQKMILEILLSYNPLWLRIGLEAIYGIVIPLKSNSDIEGLTSFIVQRMFKNPFLKNKNSKSSAPNMLLPAYVEAIKKFTLKKFFMLVYFLDQAKQKKLISHDPCLFCRNAVCKESREIIIRYTRELIAGIGDITRHLKPLGYVVCHKQSYLDEYKYAVHNLALDIRDGVRLTKVMEIIMMKNGLLVQLRTPAISRLQKIHNVQVAMNALKEANFAIVGEITATDVADGHREKTLSLLWQIIHVFRAPLFEKAANVIQVWWRKKYRVIAEKRKEERRIQKIESATITIQEYFRSYIVMKKVREEYIILRKSVTVIQSYFRSYLLAKSQRKLYIQLRITTIVLQRRFRSLLLMKKERKGYVQLRNAVLRLQEQYRARVAMRIEKDRFTKLKAATLRVQRLYRALIQMRRQRTEYLKIKSSCITIQNAYRAYQLGKPYRENYIEQKKAAVKIQRWFRSCKKVQQLQQEYHKSKQSCLAIQRFYRAYMAGRRMRQDYIRTKTATICLQRFFRAYIKMKIVKQEYIRMKTSTVVIQKFYRSHLETIRQRKEYLKMKSAVSCIENNYKQYKEYQIARKNYVQLRKATITVQRIYRSIIAMRLQRKQYIKLKQSAFTIQQKYRALLIMRVERRAYLELRSTTIVVQTRYRAQCLMKRERLTFLTIQKACISIQKHYKAYVLGKKTRQQFIKQRDSARVIQTRYKALIAMRNDRASYLAKKNAALVLQRRWQAYKLMLKYKQEFAKTTESCKMIQRYFRAYQKGKKQRGEYLKLKSSVILLQSKFRMLLERKAYLKLRSAVITVQSLYRAQYLMKQERRKFSTIQKACISIQTYYRAYVVGRKTRQIYLKQRDSAKIIQIRYRALLAMRRERTSYLMKKNAAVTIQRRWNSNILMLKYRQEYVKTLNACIKIQRYFKAYLAGKQQRVKYLRLKNSVILIQNRFRSLMKTRKTRNQYIEFRNAITTIQTRFREKQVRRNDAATKIQKWYRTIQKRNVCRKEFLMVRNHVITVQSQIRMCLVRKRFIRIRTATTTIQRYYRSYKLTTIERQRYTLLVRGITKLQSCVKRYIARKRYVRLRAAVLTIQVAYKLKKRVEFEKKRREEAAVIMQKYVRRYLVQSEYRKYREKVIYTQKCWRSKLLTRLVRCDYLQKKRIVIKIQAAARGYLVRKELQSKKDHILKVQQLFIQNRAASKIQALFRGNKARQQSHSRVAEIRQRWRAGALRSNQPTLRERNEQAILVINGLHGIVDVIDAFRVLEFISEVYPMVYECDADEVVRKIFIFMSATNRSMAGVELFMSAASITVNLARYKATGPKIYKRGYIMRVLKYMWRFVNSEKQLFCIFATYLWLFSKYDAVREDLSELLRTPKYHKIIMTIKDNADRVQRMEINNVKQMLINTPQSCKKKQSHFTKYNVSNCSKASTSSNRGNVSIVMPSIEPDYGITRLDNPKYFDNPQDAMKCLLQTYNL